MWAYFLLSDFYSRDVVTDFCVTVDMLKPICKRSLLLLVTLLSNKLLLSYVFIGASQGFPHSSVGKESTCNAGDPGLIPGSGRFAGEGIGYPLQYSWPSLVAQLVKGSPQCGRPGFDPWVGKIPWRREWLPTPVFWPGEFHGLYSIVHGVSKSQTWLSDLHATVFLYCYGAILN